MTEGRLERRLGVGDAVVIGVGSMIGAGVFTVWSPAAAAAGTGLLIGLALAAAVATCNALSSAQLAARYPESGGTYVYARHQLGAGWGHLAGWGFIVGKTASCVAIALTAGTYLWPARARAVAVVAVVAVAVVNLGGLTRTVAMTRALLVLTGAALTMVVVAGWSGDTASLQRLAPIDADVAGMLRAAGFLFFAFAGYARIATLGEEVRDPERTLPRAIPLALAAALAVYAAVAITVLAVVPVERLAATDAPLELVIDSSGFGAVGPLLRVGAGIASLGVLLNLVPGVSRTVLAMARRKELPARLAHVDADRGVPLRAEVLVTAAVATLVVIIDLRDALGFSGVAVLTYYALTNASALRLPAEHRRWPRALSVAGLVGCVVLAAALPARPVVLGTVVLSTGVLARLVAAQWRRRSS